MPFARVPQSIHDAPCVLVVDDESAVLDVTQAMAVRLGWNTLRADSGPRALRQFHAGADRVALVLLDLHLRGADGAAVARDLRRIRPGIVIVAMTGDPAAAQRMTDELRLADAVLAKPFALGDLARTLAAVPQVPCA